VEKVAAEAGFMLLSISPSMILSKWAGDSEKAISGVFDIARSFQPCIIFLVSGGALLGSAQQTANHPGTGAALRCGVCLNSGMACAGVVYWPVQRYLAHAMSLCLSSVLHSTCAACRMRSTALDSRAAATQMQARAGC
jgi:hypothetical protein